MNPPSKDRTDSKNQTVIRCAPHVFVTEDHRSIVYKNVAVQTVIKTSPAAKDADVYLQLEYTPYSELVEDAVGELNLPRKAFLSWGNAAYAPLDQNTPAIDDRAVLVTSIQSHTSVDHDKFAEEPTGVVKNPSENSMVSYHGYTFGQKSKKSVDVQVQTKIGVSPMVFDKEDDIATVTTEGTAQSDLSWKPNARNSQVLEVLGKEYSAIKESKDDLVTTRCVEGKLEDEHRLEPIKEDARSVSDTSVVHNKSITDSKQYESQGFIVTDEVNATPDLGDGRDVEVDNEKPNDGERVSTSTPLVGILKVPLEERLSKAEVETIEKSLSESRSDAEVGKTDATEDFETANTDDTGVNGTDTEDFKEEDASEISTRMIEEVIERAVPGQSDKVQESVQENHEELTKENLETSTTDYTEVSEINVESEEDASAISEKCLDEIIERVVPAAPDDVTQSHIIEKREINIVPESKVITSEIPYEEQALTVKEAICSCKPTDKNDNGNEIQVDQTIEGEKLNKICDCGNKESPVEIKETVQESGKVEDVPDNNEIVEELDASPIDVNKIKNDLPIEEKNVESDNKKTDNEEIVKQELDDTEIVEPMTTNDDEVHDNNEELIAPVVPASNEVELSEGKEKSSEEDNASAISEKCLDEIIETVVPAEPDDVTQSCIVEKRESNIVPESKVITSEISHKEQALTLKEAICSCKVTDKNDHGNEIQVDQTIEGEKLNQICDCGNEDAPVEIKENFQESDKVEDVPAYNEIVEEIDNVQNDLPIEEENVETDDTKDELTAPVVSVKNEEELSESKESSPEKVDEKPEVASEFEGDDNAAIEQENQLPVDETPKVEETDEFGLDTQETCPPANDENCICGMKEDAQTAPAEQPKVEYPEQTLTPEKKPEVESISMKTQSTAAEDVDDVEQIPTTRIPTLQNTYGFKGEAGGSETPENFECAVEAATNSTVRVLQDAIDDIRTAARVEYSGCCDPERLKKKLSEIRDIIGDFTRQMKDTDIECECQRVTDQGGAVPHDTISQGEASTSTAGKEPVEDIPVEGIPGNQPVAVDDSLGRTAQTNVMPSEEAVDDSVCPCSGPSARGDVPTVVEEGLKHKEVETDAEEVKEQVSKKNQTDDCDLTSGCPCDVVKDAKNVLMDGNASCFCKESEGTCKVEKEKSVDVVKQTDCTASEFPCVCKYISNEKLTENVDNPLVDEKERINSEEVCPVCKKKMVRLVERGASPLVVLAPSTDSAKLGPCPIEEVNDGNVESDDDEREILVEILMSHAEADRVESVSGSLLVKKLISDPNTSKKGCKCSQTQSLPDIRDDVVIRLPVVNLPNAYKNDDEHELPNVLVDCATLLTTNMEKTESVVDFASLMLTELLNRVIGGDLVAAECIKSIVTDIAEEPCAKNDNSVGNLEQDLYIKQLAEDIADSFPLVTETDCTCAEPIPSVTPGKQAATQPKKQFVINRTLIITTVNKDGSMVIKMNSTTEPPSDKSEENSPLREHSLTFMQDHTDQEPYLTNIFWDTSVMVQTNLSLGDKLTSESLLSLNYNKKYEAAADDPESKSCHVCSTDGAAVDWQQIIVPPAAAVELKLVKKPERTRPKRSAYYDRIEQLPTPAQARTGKEGAPGADPNHPCYPNVDYEEYPSSTDSEDDVPDDFTPRSADDGEDGKKKKKGCCKKQQEEEPPFMPAPPPPPPKKPKVKPHPCRGPGNMVYDCDGEAFVEPYIEGLASMFPEEPCSDATTEMPWKDILLDKNVRLCREPKSNKPRVIRVQPLACQPDKDLCVCDDGQSAHNVSPKRCEKQFKIEVIVPKMCGQKVEEDMQFVLQNADNTENRQIRFGENVEPSPGMPYIIETRRIDSCRQSNYVLSIKPSTDCPYPSVEMPVGGQRFENCNADDCAAREEECELVNIVNVPIPDKTKSDCTTDYSSGKRKEKKNVNIDDGTCGDKTNTGVNGSKSAPQVRSSSNVTATATVSLKRAGKPDQVLVSDVKVDKTGKMLLNIPVESNADGTIPSILVKINASKTKVGSNKPKEETGTSGGKISVKISSSKGIDKDPKCKQKSKEPADSSRSKSKSKVCSSPTCPRRKKEAVAVRSREKPPCSSKDQTKGAKIQLKLTSSREAKHPCQGQSRNGSNQVLEILHHFDGEMRPLKTALNTLHTKLHALNLNELKQGWSNMNANANYGLGSAYSNAASVSPVHPAPFHNQDNGVSIVPSPAFRSSYRNAPSGYGAGTPIPPVDENGCPFINAVHSLSRTLLHREPSQCPFIQAIRTIGSRGVIDENNEDFNENLDRYVYDEPANEVYRNARYNGRGSTPPTGRTYESGSTRRSYAPAPGTSARQGQGYPGPQTSAVDRQPGSACPHSSGKAVGFCQRPRKDAEDGFYSDNSRGYGYSRQGTFRRGGGCDSTVVRDKDSCFLTWCPYVQRNYLDDPGMISYPKWRFEESREDVRNPEEFRPSVPQIMNNIRRRKSISSNVCPSFYRTKDMDFLSNVSALYKNPAYGSSKPDSSRNCPGYSRKYATREVANVKCPTGETSAQGTSHVRGVSGLSSTIQVKFPPSRS